MRSAFYGETAVDLGKFGSKGRKQKKKTGKYKYNEETGKKKATKNL